MTDDHGCDRAESVDSGAGVLTTDDAREHGFSGERTEEMRRGILIAKYAGVAKKS